MSPRRSRGSLDDLLPDDRRTWAKEIWADRHEIAALESGAWMLREAAKELGLAYGEVDALLREHRPFYESKDQ